MEPDAKTPAGIAFGRFLVLPHRRILLADGRPTGLGGRAFDVLMVLIDARGSVVSKDELAARVWPGQVGVETALQSQISALRAALGEGRGLIRTVSGRGYQFAGEVRDEAPRVDPAGAGTATMPVRQNPPPTNLPAPVGPLIGRDKELDDIVDLAANHRLVTLAGAGGIGKTRLAIEAARRLMPRFVDGVWIVDFSTLSDPGLIPGAIAMAAGLDSSGNATRQLVAQTLARRSALLVLDTCEHVVGAVALMSEELLRAGAAVHVIATSREPLRAEGEWTYPVLPLAIPAEDAPENDARQYGAVRLFIERAQAVDPQFAPDPRDMAEVAAICRRLDGIPLAIELAAARIAALSLEQLLAHLQNRFELLTGGRRTALPRHQTLRATLDWSHDLLSEPERVILRRLAVFTGVFSLEAALAVVASPELPPAQVLKSGAELVAKSLVAIDMGHSARYRLLDTMRTYALEKLAQSGEHERLARRHAEYYQAYFEKSEDQWEICSAQDWMAEYAGKINDLRGALDWAFAPDGDPVIAIGLTAAAITLWMQLSLVEEARGRIEQALNAVTAGVAVDARREMKLYAGLGACLIYTGGSGPDSVTIWNKALGIADSLADAKYQMLSVWGLWAYHVNGIQYETALTLARRYQSIATGGSHPEDRLVGERMVGISYHFLGDQSAALRHIEQALPASVAVGGKRQIVSLELDPHVTARVHLARILWLQGFPDRAKRAAEQSIEDARRAHHAISFSYALHRGACPIALWCGDLAVASSYADTLLEHAERHALGRWRLYGRGFQGAIAIRRGEIETGLRMLRGCFEELGEPGIVAPRFMRFAAVFVAEALGRAGRTSNGLASIGEAISRAERTGELWEMPELLRIKGELLLMQNAPGAATAAEGQIQRALDLAQRQAALSWELRAATSMARLLSHQGRSAGGRQMLLPVYRRLTEGFETADLQSARELLDLLG